MCTHNRVVTQGFASVLTRFDGADEAVFGDGVTRRIAGFASANLPLKSTPSLCHCDVKLKLTDAGVAEVKRPPRVQLRSSLPLMKICGVYPRLNMDFRVKLLIVATVKA